jgi:hypothetical protein
MPLTPPELRKDVTVENVDKYKDKAIYQQFRDDPRF